MVQVLARNWWALLIRGIAAVIFGILAFLWPGNTWLVIGILFGAYAFVDGIFAIVAAVRAAQAHERWWPFLLEGTIGLIIAAVVFYDVGVALLAIYFMITFWAFVTGILEIVAAIHLRRQLANEWLLILAGICSIVFGVLMVWHPVAGMLAAIWIIAIYAIVFGIVMIGFSFRLRKLAHDGDPALAAAVAAPSPAPPAPGNPPPPAV